MIRLSVDKWEYFNENWGNGNLFTEVYMRLTVGKQKLGRINWNKWMYSIQQQQKSL